MSATAVHAPPAGEAQLTVKLPAEVIEAIAERAAAIVLHRLNKPAAESPFMTVAEAATYARCKPQRIYDLLSSRRLTRHKDGSRTLIQRAELEAYLAATTGPRTGGRTDSISARHRATVDSPGNRASP
jgi:excisionase family DNA binding protein